MDELYQAMRSQVPVSFQEANPIPPAQTMSIDDDTRDPAPMSIDDGAASFIPPKLPIGVINSRAAKADLGLAGKTDVTQDTFATSIKDGKEPEARADAANQITQSRIQFAQDMIRQGKVNDIEAITNLVKPVDPDMVVETHYADAYMNHLDWPKQTDSIDSWAYNDTGALDAFKLKGTGLASRFEYLRTLQQNAEGEQAGRPFWDTLDSQGNTVPGRSDEILKDIITFGAYSETQLRGNVEGTGFFSGLGLGTNLDAQAIKLFDIQSDEDFKSQIDKIYNSMPIGLRSEFLSAMIGMSNSEVFLNNFMTAANVVPFASDAKGIAKLAFSAVKNPTLAMQTAKTAVIDMVKQAPRIEVPPQVAAPAVAGNLPESSVRKVVIDKINELSGKNDPVQDLKDRLFEYSRVDREQVLANPGTLGREGANRILDVYDSSDANFASTVLADPTKGGAQRVNVAPTVEVEDRVKKIQAGLADLHRGPDTQILQVSKPIYIPGLNVYVHNVAIGTNDSKFFSSAEEAQVVAEQYMGLPVKGTLIRTPENDKIWAEYGHYIRVAEEQGDAAGAELLRERMYSMVTRHEEGVTIEYQGSKGIEAERDLISKIQKLEKDAGIASKNRSEVVEVHGSQSTEAAKAFDKEDAIKKNLVDLNAQLKDLQIKRLNTYGTIEQQGTGYYINKVVPLPLDKNFVTDGLITTKFETSDSRDLPLYDIKAYRKDMKEGNVSTGVPPGWASGLANAILGRARTPAERLSQAENINRLTAKHGPSILLGMLQDGSGPIVKIPALEWKDFDRLTRYAMKAHNEGTKIPGIWFNNPDEIEKWYLQNLNKTAPDYMINAYFSFKKIMLDDLSMRSISVLGKKYRIGAMQHAISFNDKDGQRVTTDFFEGVRQQELPRDHLNILVSRENVKDSRVMRSDRIPPKQRAELEEDIKNGRAKIIQILDPKTKPLSGITSRRVEYVVSYNHEEKPLSFAPLNRMGGGHFIPKFDWYIKQPSTEIERGVGNDLGRDVTHYNGMKTLMSMQTKAQGEEVLPHLEAVRQLFAKHASRTKNLDEEAVAAFENEGGAVPHDYLEDAVEANRKTGIPFHKHMEWYFGNEDHGPYLNLHEPLVVLPKNRDLLDMPAGQSLINKYHKPSEGKIFMDGTKDGSLMAKMMTEFTGERDSEELYTMINKGTSEDPIFSYEPAPYVDPITSMERAFSRMSKSMYLDEMKAFSASHWVKQAEPYLTHSPEQLMAAPLHYMHNPQYKSGVGKEVIAQLESNRKQAIDFLGRPSDVDAVVYSKLNKIADAIYNKASSIESKTFEGKIVRQGLKEVVVVPLWMAPKLRDPVGVIRSYAFHGSFLVNPSAFFTQFANFGNILALAPRHAATSGMATALYAVSRLSRTPEMMAKLDRMAVEFTLTGRLGITSRWKPGQFTEAMTILEGSGWDHVGNTNAFKDSIPTNRIVSTKLGSFLKWAQMPMQAGAKTTRVGGWFAAYLEWAERNPGKAIDRAGIDQIKRRASILDTNMSSAMSSNLHTGWMSIPMQFQAYSLRMAEQFFGKDLSRQEKAQLFGMTWLLWGVRGGAVTATGLGSSFLLQWAYENGYAEGKNTWVDFAINGLPSLIGAFITGGGDPHKGDWYNFGKLGNATGIDPLEKIFQSDNVHGTVLGILGGPSGSMLSDLWNRTYGLRMSMTDPRFHATSADALAVLRTFTFMSKGWQAWMAQKTGAWYTKNENMVASDITSSQELMALLVGVQPTRWGDAFYKQKSISDEEKHIRETVKQFGIEIARGAMADKDKDPGNRDVHFKNARVLFEMIPPEKQGGAMKEAWRNYGEDLISRIDWKFLETFKDTKQMQKIQEVEQGKKR